MTQSVSVRLLLVIFCLLGVAPERAVAQTPAPAEVVARDESAPALRDAEQSAAAPAVSVPGVSAPAVSPVPYDRFSEFLDDSVRGYVFYIQVGGAGLIDQLARFPKEWEGKNGYLKRNVARAEQLFMAEAIGHGVAAALHHQVAYDLCTCRGFLPRTMHAIVRVFVSRHEDGHLTPNISRMFAAYGSAAVADFWYPASYTKSDMFWQATTSFGTGAGLNMLREFIFR